MKAPMEMLVDDRMYEGRRTSAVGGQPVDVLYADGRREPLVHRVSHSPDGFQWGYGGSGPSDLARSLLWDAIGREPSAALYQRFKFAVVAGLPDHWSIGRGRILMFVAGWIASGAEAGPGE